MPLRTLLARTLAACSLLSTSAAIAEPVQWRVEDGGNGHWYDIIQPTVSTWTAARDAAAALTYAGMPGHLATIGSAAENDFVGALGVARIGTFQHGNIYIGFFQDQSAPDFSEPAGGWRWCTGEPVTFLAWGGGEPNNAAGIENFAYLGPSATPGGSGWNDWGPGTCCTPAAYAVEYGLDTPMPPTSCATWTQNTTTALPPVRREFGLAYDEARGQAVLFGGGGTGPGPAQVWNDTWLFNGTTWTQYTGSGPGYRAAAPMAYDPVRQRVVLFSGSRQDVPGGTYFSDTWEWDGQAWQQVASIGPPPRINAMMAFDPVRNRMVLAGGTRSFAFCDCWVTYNDVWEWDGAMWTQMPSLPETLSGAAMDFDPMSGRMVVFGGEICQPCGNTKSPRTYVRNGITWSLASSTGPSARSNTNMVFVPPLGGMLLFGSTTGHPDGETGDTWFWNGVIWQQIAIGASPSRRENNEMYFEPNTQRLVSVFGWLNNTNTYLTEMWSFSADIAATILTQPSSLGLIPGTNQRLSVEAAGTNLSYQWRRDGVPLTNGMWISGATTPTLQLGLVRCDDLGAYDCVVSKSCGSVATTGVTTTKDPIITQAPPSVSILKPGLKLTVGVPPGAGYAYRWFYNTGGPSANVGTNPVANIPGVITGATRPTLQLLSGDASQVGNYYCFVTGCMGFGNIAPSYPGAGVYCPTDIDHDFFVSPDDLGDYITAYFDPEGALAASFALDFNEDSVVDPDDLGDFITRYFEGC